MWNIGDLCVYYVPEETSSILACVKNVDNVRKRLLLHPFSENDPETWISMSSVFRLTDLYRVNFGMNEPNSSATLQVIFCYRFNLILFSLIRKIPILF